MTCVNLVEAPLPVNTFNLFIVCRAKRDVGRHTFRMWSPAECKHCGYEIQPVEVGNPHNEPSPSGWVHNPDMVDHRTYYDNNDKLISEHNAHPADNRSKEQEYHGADELMKTHDTHIEFNKIMRNNNLSGEQF